jgi:D,D-heptose 1,7-bisphosphate phosphatase
MQAIILAGGKGPRLGALTRGLPKPLVPVAGKPFICHLIENLARHGFRNILLLVGAFAAAYEKALGTGGKLGVRLQLVSEPQPADTAGALHHAAPFLQPRFLLLNGDSFFDFNYLDLVAKRSAGSWLARIALREVDDVSRYGTVSLAAGQVTSFGEKGGKGEGLINGGVYWLKREILAEIGTPPVSLERDLFPGLASRGLLRGSNYSGRFIDIGVPADLRRARRLMVDWTRRPAAFLDRDGVINRDIGYLHRREEFEWIPGAKRAVKRLNDAGFFVFVVTNQAGIARGFYTADAVERLHRWISGELHRLGAHIDAFYYCPHHPEHGLGAYRQRCACRKPAPGMLLQAMRAWPIERERSFMIGDKEIDMEAARRAKVRGIMMREGNLDELVRDAISTPQPRQPRHAPSTRHPDRA